MNALMMPKQQPPSLARSALQSSLFLWAMVMIAPASAQEHSVLKPGFNNYENENLDDNISGFESETREIYRYREAIIALLDLRPGESVADIGAGTGFFAEIMARRVGREGTAYAVDITPKFVEHIAALAKRKSLHNLEPILCDAKSTGLEPNSVDLVFTCDTYHHFEYPQDTLASIHAALRPGGRLWIIDMKRYLQEGEPPNPHVRAGKGTVEDEIRDAGFAFRREIELMRGSYILEFEKPGEDPAHRLPPRMQEFSPTRDLADTGPALFRVVLQEVENGRDMPTMPGIPMQTAQPQTLRALLARAHGLTSGKCEIRDIDEQTDKLYTLDVDIPGDDEELRHRLMRQALEFSFGLRTSRESRAMDVLVVSCPEGAQKKWQDLPELSLCVSLRDGQLRLLPEEKNHKQVLIADFSDMIELLETTLSRPVIDATGLEGRYDLPLSWNPEKPESILASLREQLGLRITSEHREIEFLIAEPRQAGASK